MLILKIPEINTSHFHISKEPSLFPIVLCSKLTPIQCTLSTNSTLLSKEPSHLSCVPKPSKITPIQYRTIKSRF